ncbi:MAG: type IV toxin-antitoxin system AbiEi family antitoxin, partial [Chloroflexota bacterium]|nr:type IV toxin-antitoxin system AbiEi family antitoxin [Chloroflexota bacterium]
MVSEAEVKAQFINRLATLLPQLEIEKLEADKSFQGTTFDFVARVKVGEVRKILLGEVKSCGQPRYLRQVIAQFGESGIASDSREGASPSPYFVIAAPYFSPRGLEICQRHKVGCVDLAGNCYLEFDGVYIERIVEEKPKPVRRMLKSLFSPVSSRIVRAMLEEPGRVWKLKELAEATGASLGQTYNVSEKLALEGFAQKSTRGGVTLIDPAGLLDAWREEYDVTVLNKVHSFHSWERDPARLMARVKQAAERLGARYAFTLHAGASLVAPYVRFNDVHFYVGADPQAWVDALDLHTVEFGGNVHLLRPYDEGVFYRLRTRQGMAVVGNIQLYLDLYKYPGRGREQAEFLREKEIGF